MSAFNAGSVQSLLRPATASLSDRRLADRRAATATEVRQTAARLQFAEQAADHPLRVAERVSRGAAQLRPTTAYRALVTETGAHSIVRRASSSLFSRV